MLSGQKIKTMDHVNFEKNRKQILADLWATPVLADYAPAPSKPASGGSVPVLLPVTDTKNGLGYSPVMINDRGDRRRLYGIQAGVEPTPERKEKVRTLNALEAMR